MGESKRKMDEGKTTHVVSSETLEALRIAAQMIRSPSMYPNFSCIMLGANPDDLTEETNEFKGTESTISKSIVAEFNKISDDAWIEGMSKGFEREPFRKLLRAIVENGRGGVVGRKIVVQDESGDVIDGQNPVFTAMQTAVDRLSGDLEDPRWLALVVFSLARMIGTTASSQYRSNVWSDFTLLFFSLERDLLKGDGEQFAKGLM